MIYYLRENINQHKRFFSLLFQAWIWRWIKFRPFTHSPVLCSVVYWTQSQDSCFRHYVDTWSYGGNQQAEFTRIITDFISANNTRINLFLLICCFIWNQWKRSSVCVKISSQFRCRCLFRPISGYTAPSVYMTTVDCDCWEDVGPFNRPFALVVHVINFR